MVFDQIFLHLNFAFLQDQLIAYSHFKDLNKAHIQSFLTYLWLELLLITIENF